MKHLLRVSFFLFPFSFLILTSCSRDAGETVTLYTSVDQPYAAPIIKDFEQKTGIKVTLVTDAEATKSVGLAERVRAERNNPQCDVFWSNEPFHTINLANESLLEPYDSPSAADVPAQFKDPHGRWCGNALRARVIGVHGETAVAKLDDLTKPELKDRIAMAKPTAGTTGGHVAALYVLWGDEKAKAFFVRLRQNGVKLLGGNAKVAEAVGQGTVLAGLTDNDDVAATKKNGGKIEGVLPDQNDFGMLMVPTTVGIIARERRPQAAQKLVDHLLSKETEQKLIAAGFAGWSVRETAGATKVTVMNVDYAKVAEVMPRAVREATSILEGRE